MKCKNCCFYTILDPKISINRSVCVRNPPVYMEDEYGDYKTLYPRPKEDWWCGEWKPEGFIKMWPDNLTEEF